MNSLIGFVIFICLFLMLIILGLIYKCIKIDCEKIGRDIIISDRNIIVDKDGTKHYENVPEKEHFKVKLMFDEKGWKIYQVNEDCKHYGFILINENGSVDFKDGTIYDLVTYCNITYAELGNLKYDNKLILKD